MKARFDELRRYVRFGDEDLENLRAFYKVAAPEFPRISQEFYDRIREHEHAHAVISGEDQIQRLQRSLVRWMERVCTGARDDAYVAETVKIGVVHVRIGLPQRYVFTAMALIHVAFDAIADEKMGERARAVRAAITRALDLELAIMLETYHDDFNERLERLAALERSSLGRALARNEHLYAHAVELAPYLVVGIDRQGRIVLFNEAAERASQTPRDQVFGHAFLDALFVEGGGPHRDAILEVIDGRRGQHVVRECPLRTRAGRLRIVEWSVAHTPSPNEEVVAFAIGRDVTEEAALAERTRQAEKLAAVGTLAAGLAHEIRNPLNGAHLHITFLERGLKKSGANPEALEAVRVVGDEITRLSQLVTEFLDFARPKPLDRQPVVVQRMCERIGQLVAPQVAAARCSLDLDMPAADLVIDADRVKIEQVLLNLVQNAVEAMAPTGGGRVGVRARRLPLHALIEVEDQGPGLSDPSAPIFDAFYSTKPNGTGLGLAIVHRIVTDHSGTITFESRPGRTVFRATLPLAQPSV
ncbi:MAG: PAS domain S-box protein [Deltaproteobacteria bacterium]|nr:PAS domain S-box protein [Deltaproteobacteria bacterium]